MEEMSAREKATTVFMYQSQIMSLLENMDTQLAMDILVWTMGGIIFEHAHPDNYEMNVQITSENLKNSVLKRKRPNIQ